MSRLAQLKNAAIAVTAVVTIVSGVDKLGRIYRSWRLEYIAAREEDSTKKKNPVIRNM